MAWVIIVDDTMKKPKLLTQHIQIQITSKYNIKLNDYLQR